MTGEVQSAADAVTMPSAASDELATTRQALAEANRRTDQLTGELKAANARLAQMDADSRANAGAIGDRTERGRALVAAFDHAMQSNAPMTLPMLRELRALLLPPFSA
jgi:hypothetical protein